MPLPAGESARLAALAEHGLAACTREPAFDRIAGLAADLAGAAIAMVVIVLGEEERCLGASGIAGDPTPGRHGFAAPGLMSDAALVVPDARHDPRFATHPLVAGPPGIRFLAGVPLTLAPGVPAGMLCVADARTRPDGLDPATQVRLTALAATAVDLIRQRGSARQAEQVGAELESVLEAMPATLAVYDHAGVLHRANRLFRTTLLPPDAREGINAAEIEATLPARGHRLFPMPVPQGGRGRHYEVALADGRWLRGSVVSAGPGRIVGAGIDITDLKARERTIAAQGLLLQAALDTIDLGILVIGPDLSVLLCNDHYFDMVRAPDSLRRLGASFEDVLWHWASTVARLEERPEEYVAASLRSLARRESSRLEVPARDGRHLVIQRVAMADGRFLVTVEDVTRTRAAERARDEFVATVSHELRTPLTSIAGSLGLLAGGAAGALEPRSRRMVEIAYANSRRLVRLINDILDIEKIDSDRAPFVPAVIDAHAATAAAVDALRAYADGFGVVVELGFASEDPPRIRADPDRFAQVVTNLVSNAVRFSPTGGTVEVAVAGGPRPGLVRLSVRDQGPGIPAAFRPRLFQRFAQAGGQAGGQKGGTGLGLAIVREIVQRHGGDITVESEEGVGTAFHVDLPAAPRQPNGAQGGVA